jgi:hypothetical protein
MASRAAQCAVESQYASLAQSTLFVQLEPTGAGPQK